MKPLSMFIKRIFLLLLFLGLPGAFAETTTPDDSGVPGYIVGWENGNTCKFQSAEGTYYVKLWLVKASPKEGHPNYQKLIDDISGTFYGAGSTVDLKIIYENPKDDPPIKIGVLTSPIPGAPSSCQEKFWKSGCGFDEEEYERWKDTNKAEEAKKFREIYEKIQKEKQDLERSKNAKQPVEIDYKEFRAAVNKGDVAEVKRLLDAGADANAQAVDTWGSKSTVLIEAAKRGHLEIVELLVGHRANVNAVDNDGPRGYKNTALTRAAENRHSDVVKFLVEHGADVNAQRTDGYTALFFAVEKGLDLKTIKLLLDKGADPNVKVNVGHDYYVSLIYRAKNWRKPGPSKGKGPNEEELQYRKDLVDLLIRYGAIDEEARAKEQQARDDGVSATAFSKSGGGKNTTAAQKTEGPQADEGAPIYPFGFQRPSIPEDALKGTLFDLMSPTPNTEREIAKTCHNHTQKEDAYRKYQKERGERLKKAIGILSSSWDIEKIKLRKYRFSKIPLSTTNIYYPSISVGSFLKDEKGTEVQKCWLCFYEGEFGVPEEGDYRFVGSASTVMLVGVDALDKKGMKPVLYAFIPGQGYSKLVRNDKGWEPGNDVGEVNGSDLYKGTWLHLLPGKRYPIKIALGYCAGDDSHPLYNSSPHAYLGVQRRGLKQTHSDTDEDFPLFTLEKVSSKRPERSLSQPKGGRPKTGPYNTSCVFAPPEE